MHTSLQITQNDSVCKDRFKILCVCFRAIVVCLQHAMIHFLEFRTVDLTNRLERCLG